MARFDLPGGGWADIADPATVSERKRRPVLRASTNLAAHVGNLDGDMDGDAMGLLGDLNDLVCVALITAWSYETPVTLDAVLDLPGDVYDALRAECAKFSIQLLPDFGPSPDPASPSVPLSA